MKKTFAIILTVVMALSLFSGCAEHEVLKDDEIFEELSTPSSGETEEEEVTVTPEPEESFEEKLNRTLEELNSENAEATPEVVVEEAEGAEVEAGHTHDFTEVVEDTAATCAKEGIKIMKCACGATQTTKTAKLSHKYELESQTEATCTVAGKAVYKCKDCGETTTKTFDATGHSYTEKITKAATCTESGTKTLTCSVCGQSTTETIPATGHDYKTTKSKATCTAGGKVNYVCSKCGDKKTEDVSALGHDFVLTSSTKATCTTAGKNVYTCSRCGEKKEETIAATGHTLKTVTTNPTCVKDGSTVTKCTVCGYVQSSTTIAAKGHSYKRVSRAATCTTDGYEGDECTVCGATANGKTVKATGHSYEVVSHTDATCCEYETTVKKCKNCGDTVTEKGSTLAAHNYVYDKTKTHTEETTSAYIIYAVKVCSACGAEVEEVCNHDGGTYWDTWGSGGDSAHPFIEREHCDKCGADLYWVERFEYIKAGKTFDQEMGAAHNRMKYSNQQIAEWMLAYINALRYRARKNGGTNFGASFSLSDVEYNQPLVIDSDCMAYAAWRITTVRDEVNGGTVHAGNTGDYGENVVEGCTTCRTAFKSMLLSSSHCQLMADASSTGMGVAAIEDNIRDGAWHMVVNFVGKLSQEIYGDELYEEDFVDNYRDVYLAGSTEQYYLKVSPPWQE